VGVIVTVGKGFTVTITVFVFVQPLAPVPVTVYVRVEVGLATTLIPVVTFNPADGLQAYVVAPLAVKVVLAPLHSVEGAGETDTVGVELTVTVIVFVPMHPLAPVPVTVYVRVDVGLATTFIPVVTFNPVEGLQAYVVAPLAVKVVLAPPHNVEDAGEIDTVGVGFTATINGRLLLHPFVVPVTV
jgi:phage terminase large subunit-like protein